MSGELLSSDEIFRLTENIRVKYLNIHFHNQLNSIMEEITFSFLLFETFEKNLNQ